MDIRSKRSLISRLRYNINLILLLSLCSVVGQEKIARESEVLALDPAVRYGKLENGFTYYLRKNQVPSNKIFLQLVVKAGYYHEDEDQLEYAHLLEHMGAKATKNFPDVDKFFGGSGTYSSAETSSDFTRYYVNIPANDKAALAASLQLLRDQAQDIGLKETNIDKERGAVLGEMRTNDPYHRYLMDIISKQAVENTGFKPDDLKKAKESIENFNATAFNRFYRDWYRPDLQAAIIVGDINVDSVERVVKQLFSDLKMPKKVKNAQERVELQKVELPGENKVIKIVDTVDQDSRLTMISKRINHEHRPENRNDYRRRLLQRLYEEIVNSRKEGLEQQYDPPFSNLSTNYRANSVAGGQLDVTLMNVPFKGKSLYQKKKDFINAIVAWNQIHDKWTQLELDKAKVRLRQVFAAALPPQSSDLVKKYLIHFVGGAAAPHPQVEEELNNQLLSEIELDEVQRFADKRGNLRKNVDFLFFTGGEDDVPKERIVEKWIDEAENQKVVSLKFIEPIIPTLKEVTVPIKENLGPEEICSNLIGVSMVELHNGITLVLKPTKPRLPFLNGKVTIEAFRQNIIPIEEKKTFLTAQIAPEVVKYSGGGRYNKFELDRFMKEYDINLRFGLNNQHQFLESEVDSANVEELLKLIYLYSSQPRKDSVAFAVWKDKKEELLMRQPRSSSEFYMDSITTRWFPQVPDFTTSDLEQLKMNEVFDAFDQWFSGFEDYTFIVTGDFQKKLLSPILIKYLSAFPVRSLQKGKVVKKLKFPMKKINDTIYLKNFDQAGVNLYFPFTAQRDIKTQIELELIVQALHEAVYTSLRRGAYTPRATGEWLDVDEGVYAYRISFDSELGNEEKMIEYGLDAFRELRNTGVDQKWLEKAIADESNEYGKNIDSFGYINFWSSYLQEKLENGEGIMAEVLSYEAVLEHFITLEELNSSIKKHLREDNYQEFLFLPDYYNPLINN